MAVQIREQLEQYRARTLASGYDGRRNETDVIEKELREELSPTIEKIAELETQFAVVKNEAYSAYSRLNDSVCQTLGKVLGFPWYKDDQVNFPGATEHNGVCLGHYVAEDMIELAAARIKDLEKELLRFKGSTNVVKEHRVGEELENK